VLDISQKQSARCRGIIDKHAKHMRCPVAIDQCMGNKKQLIIMISWPVASQFGVASRNLHVNEMPQIEEQIGIDLKASQ
jgi:hypothetical protein